MQSAAWEITSAFNTLGNKLANYVGTQFFLPITIRTLWLVRRCPTLIVSCALIFAVFGAVEDLCWRRIPNLLTYSGFLGALLVRCMTSGWPGLTDGLRASLIAGGALFVLFLLGGMGAGDVKLMAAVAAWDGSERISDLLFVTAVAGGVIAIGAMLWRKRVSITLRNALELMRHHLTT